jgi:hypothetical protein
MNRFVPRAAAAGCILAACLVPALASAGKTFSRPVSITSFGTVGGEFFGTLSATRASSDADASMGCEVQSTASGAPWIMCNAYTSTQGAACHSASPQLAAALVGVNQASYMLVEYDGQANCTNIWVENRSDYLP